MISAVSTRLAPSRPGRTIESAIRMSAAVTAFLQSLRAELASARKAKNLYLYQIVQALIWIGEGESVAEAARRFRITCKTVYNWIWEFASKKFSWLAWHHFQGCGRK
jgi:hypothetical protein